MGFKVSPVPNCERQGTPPFNDNTGSTYNWIDPIEMRHTLGGAVQELDGGRTKYVLPFSMGPVGSPMSQIGRQLTDSAHIVVNIRIMVPSWYAYI